MKRYQAKKEYVMRDVAGETILIARGAATVDSNCVMVFNETGALLYRSMLEFPMDADALANILREKYEIDPETAKSDTEACIEKMLEAGIVEEV